MGAAQRPSEIGIDFTTQQLELLDRLAAQWGLSRAATVERILKEAVAETRSSGRADDSV